MKDVASVLELANHVSRPEFNLLREFYSVGQLPAVDLRMNESAWQEASAIFGVPRAQVEKQHIVTVRDLHLGHEAMFNPLRLNRVRPPGGRPAVDLIDEERRREGCSWCDNGQNTEFLDDFGSVYSSDCRIRARGNWARGCAISGVIYGDEATHNLLRLSKTDFVELFVTAERYMVKARTQLPAAKFFLCFLNGGPKSAAGVSHCHLQVLGRTDSHFAYAENIRERCPSDYWPRLEAIHQEIGLGLNNVGSSGWVSLAPMKERDLVFITPSIERGAAFVFDVLQVLYANGTNNFTLAAIPSPAYFCPSDTGHSFWGWPPVLWRFVDRGDMRARHSDIGGAELFGSTVVATDPWLVARWLSRWSR